VLAVPWESMRNNPTDGRLGWNFSKDQRTQMPVDGAPWLFEQVGQDASVRECKGLTLRVVARNDFR
jgi:hypothetical protein